VKVYTFDSVPKISIYGCGKEALIGFFWPARYAAHTPQLLIEGDDGHFSREVWDYYSKLDKKEITNDLVKRIAKTTKT